MNVTNTSQRTNVLVIQAENSHEDLLNLEFPPQQFTFKKLSAGKDITATIEENNFTSILLQSVKNATATTSTVNCIRAADSEIPIIVVTDSTSETFIEKLVNENVTEILFHPINTKMLMTKIKLASQNYVNRKELLSLRQQVAMNYGFDNFVGLSRDIQKIKRNIQHIAADDTTVILSGPDGSGKNLLAKIIHYHSPRRHSPFVAIDCSTLSTEQIRHELFGSETSLVNSQSIFERSENGTIFIDKFDLIDTEIQNQIELCLRCNFESADQTEHKNGFRLLMSVTSPVYDLVKAGKLNKSFIDSLSAVEFALPPLSQRKEDIELLTAYFLRLISFESDTPPVIVTPAAVEVLKNHTWPGNVRELENCLRRAAALCTNNALDIADISFISAGTSDRNLGNLVNNSRVNKASLAESQRYLIAEALDANNWNFTHTAKQLGIGRTTLWRKVRKYNLTKEKSNRLETSGVTADD